MEEMEEIKNPPIEVYPEDNVIFSLPAELTKVVWSQSPTSKTGLPNTRGEATSKRLPHSKGSAQTSDKGECQNENWARRAQHNSRDSSNYTCEPDLGVSNVIHNTKYGSEVLQGMKKTVSTVKNPAWKSANQHVKVQVEALADSASIITWDLAKKVKC